MKPTGLCTAVLAGFVAVAAAERAVAQVEIVEIPRHPVYGDFSVRNVSGDGLTVVGSVSSPNGSLGMTWTRIGGFEAVPEQELLRTSILSSASHDGSVLVGSCTADGSMGFMWVRGQGVFLMRDPSGEPRTYTASSVSGDGRYASCRAVGRGNTAVRWSIAGGFENFPGVRGVPSLDGVDISGDGRAAVGLLSGGASFYWTESGGSRLIPLPADHVVWGAARLTTIGDVVFGQAQNVQTRERSVFIWSEETGATLLPDGPWNAFRLSDSSDDGRIIVGGTDPAAFRSVGFIWTLGNGFEFLGDYLGRHGARYPITSFRMPVAVSDDARVIVGTEGVYSDWMIVLPPARVADFNRDEVVDEDDLRDFVACFQGEGILPVSTADLNGDGFTDFFDLMEFLSDY